MKNIALSLAVLMALSASVFCQTKTKEKEKAAVPAAVKSAFTKSYPGVKAKWEKEKGKEAFEAEFEKDDKDMSVVYSAKGELLETEVEIAVSELPAAVSTYVATHHKGAKIKEAAKITDAKGTITYEAEVKGHDLFFDANGNPLKSK